MTGPVEAAVVDGVPPPPVVVGVVPPERPPPPDGFAVVGGGAVVGGTVVVVVELVEELVVDAFDETSDATFFSLPPLRTRARMTPINTPSPRTPSASHQPRRLGGESVGGWSSSPGTPSNMVSSPFATIPPLLTARTAVARRATRRPLRRHPGTR